MEKKKDMPQNQKSKQRYRERSKPNTKCRFLFLPSRICIGQNIKGNIEIFHPLTRQGDNSLLCIAVEQTAL